MCLQINILFMIQILIHKNYAHIIQRTSTLWKNSEDCITTYLPTIFLEQSNLDHKIPYTIKSVPYLPVISVLKTRFFPWTHLKKTKLLLSMLSFLYSHLIANGTGVSYSISYNVLPLWLTFTLTSNPIRFL